MANKILKTLTLPNAQGEPVTYELAPKWENLQGEGGGTADNLNDVIHTGIYRCDGNTNLPAGVTFSMLFVMSDSENETISQMCIDSEDGQVFTRAAYSGAWTKWESLSDKIPADAPPLADGTNLGDVYKTGFYNVPSYLETYTDLPAANEHGVLLVAGDGSYEDIQVFFSGATEKIYMRTSSEGTWWSDWNVAGGNADLTQASGILPITNGGTGNADGYIRTGAKPGVAIGQHTTIEGYLNEATGDIAHVEGAWNAASGTCSHAEGAGTEAKGARSHTEGSATFAEGIDSHAEGNGTCAYGTGSHVEGNGTVASGDYQHVEGQYNIEDSNNAYAHIVGNGIDNSSRSNAHTLDWSGNAWYAGSITATKLILGPESYGTSLPETGIEGQIFFLLGGSSGTATDDGNGIITLG